MQVRFSLWKSKFEFYYRVTKVPLYCTAALPRSSSVSRNHFFWGGCSGSGLKICHAARESVSLHIPHSLSTQVDYLPGKFKQFHASSYILGVRLTHFYLYYVGGIFRRFLRVRSQICQSAANHSVKVVSQRKKMLTGICIFLPQ